MQPRTRGADPQRPAAVRIDEPCGEPHRAIVCIQREIVIVAAGDAQLLVVVVNSSADRFHVAEVERRFGYQPELAGRDRAAVDRCKAIGVDLQPVIQDIAVRRCG